MADFQPEVFGRYFLIDRIAVGGMAEIFKAKTYSHAGFEKLLVIKRILDHLSENDDFVSMFIDEAKISVLLQHSNIVHVYDFGKLHQNCYIAMEYVDGKDVKLLLRELARRGKRLPEEFALYVASEVCKALDYAHGVTDLHGTPLNVVHRDISPSNVLLAYSGEVKLADFGIAKAESRAYNTADGVLKGKFEYMSPEQARGEALTPSSDIFSAGVVLWEMLTGHRAFKSDSDIQTLERIKKGDLAPPSALNPALSHRLDALVMRALAPLPSQRYPSARDFQTALLEQLYPTTPDIVQRSFTSFLEELFAEQREAERASLELNSRIAQEMYGSGVPEVQIEPEWEEPPSDGLPTLRSAPSARTPLVVSALAVAVLIVGGTAAWVLGRPRPEPTPPPVQPAPTTGSLAVKIGPVGALVSVDGVDAGTGTRVKVPELAPGRHLLRVTAEGYLPFEQPIGVEAGSHVVVPVVLQPEPAPESPPQGPRREARPPPPAAGVATVRLSSTPPGASVYIDGALVGRTPMTWSPPAPGQRHQVRYELPGYEAQGFAISPAEGSSTASRKLRRKAAAPGALSVNLSRGWANVFIDGRKLGDTTPLFGLSLQPGSHRVRVLNQAAGIDQTREVTVKSGETTTLTFRVE